MSSINYAAKFANQIDERFSIACVTEKAVNKNFEFEGVNTVFVYTADVAEVNDYSTIG